MSIESNDFSIRIEELKMTAAQTKFISFEPLLGHIEYKNYRGIDWILVGGESGGKARKIDKEWVVSIRNNCIENKVPFFLTQWG